MAKDRSLVRASDLSSWAFCHRAWWLREVQGAAHDAPEVLDRGSAAHVAHGKRVRGAVRLSKAGIVLILVGLAMIGVLVLWQALG